MFILLRDIWKPFTKAREIEWMELNEKLKKVSSGLGVSVAERQEGAESWQGTLVYLSQWPRVCHWRMWRSNAGMYYVLF